MTPAEHQETQQPTLKAFLDNELSWGRQFAVRLHLARCASCREELQTMQQIGKELRGQTTIDPLDPGLRARILATVQEMKPEPTAPVRSRRPTLIWGGAAFAALLLVAVFVSSPRFAPVFEPQFASVSRSLIAPRMGGAQAPAAATGSMSASPAPLTSNYTPQEADKSAGESPTLDAPRPETPQATPRSQSDGSIAAHTAEAKMPKIPQSKADNRVAQIDSGSPSSSEAQDSLYTSLPKGKDIAGHGYVAAKKVARSPLADSKAPVPQNLARNMLSPTSPGSGGGGFQGKQESAADAVTRDGAGASQHAVVLERAGFDLNGFQFVPQGGQKIVVPFRKSLNVVRFARSIDSRMVLDRAARPPVLYLGPAGTLINDAVPGARWQPLPPSFNSTMPIYVRPAPDWKQFLAMRWYPNMTVVGGLYSLNAPDNAFTWLSGSHIQIGTTLYPDFAAYRAFADGHPDSQRLRAVYSRAAASLPTASPAVPAKTPQPGVPPANTPKAGGRAGGKSSP